MEDQTNELLERVQNLAQTIAAPAGPNYGIITIDTKAFRDELVDAFVGELPDFQHIVLELAPTQVENMVETLREKMPPEILESPDTKWIIHVINLEVSLYHEIWTEEQAFLQELDQAVDALNEEFPFITLFYAGHYLGERFQNEAKGLWEAAPLKENFVDENFKEKTTAQEISDLKEELEKAVSDEDDSSMTRIYGAMGKLIYVEGRIDWAMELLEKALEKREAASSPSDTANALFVNGLCLIVNKETDEGLELIDEAIELYESDENHDELASSYQFLGDLFSQSRDFKKARPYYEAALASARKADKLTYIIRAAERLANIHLGLGNLDAAANYFGSLGNALLRDEKQLEAARAYQKQASTYQDQRKWQDALSNFQKALEIAQAEGDDFLISALEDSVSDMQEKVDTRQKKQQRRKGFFGKFRG